MRDRSSEPEEVAAGGGGTGEAFTHRTVLLEETLALLARAGEGPPRDAVGGRAPEGADGTPRLSTSGLRVLVDATLGGGGHAEALLSDAAPGATLIGIDRDPAALAAARGRLAPFGDRVQLVHGSFGALEAHLDTVGVPPGTVDALVADLGVSSPQLDDPARGFSFGAEGPLDMRMDPTRGRTARELLDEVDAEDLEGILRELGEERRARGVARSVLRARDEGRLETTGDLRRAVVRVLGPKRGRIDPATRTFQALRLAVNAELDELDRLVDALPRVLRPGGVAALISFHSLEDRRVKWAFRQSPVLEPLTKKPVVASEEEARDNPRSRSAKLRAARRRDREEGDSR
jgi:16S rRNA (cytosine1402-N4)-methyltransferase